MFHPRSEQEWGTCQRVRSLHRHLCLHRHQPRLAVAPNSGAANVAIAAKPNWSWFSKSWVPVAVVRWYNSTRINIAYNTYINSWSDIYTSTHRPTHTQEHLVAIIVFYFVSNTWKMLVNFGYRLVHFTSSAMKCISYLSVDGNIDDQSAFASLRGALQKAWMFQIAHKT